MQPKKRNMAHELVVLKSDLTSLFVDGAIDSNIIDASFFIMSENEAKMGQEQNLYLPSFLFNDMEKTNSESDQQHIDRTLKRLLEENVDKVGKVFMLIQHYFHFTLVVWDIKNGKMTHYNSKLPRIEGATDMYFKHAVQVRDKIEALYKDYKADQTLKIEVERCLTCAQQREDSLDCGIFVIHFANRIHEGNPIESSFPKEEVFMKRASIATTLVNHPHSYPNELKRLLEEKKVARKFDYIEELFGDDDNDEIVSL